MNYKQYNKKIQEILDDPVLQVHEKLIAFFGVAQDFHPKFKFKKYDKRRAKRTDKGSHIRNAKGKTKKGKKVQRRSEKSNGSVLQKKQTNELQKEGLLGSGRKFSKKPQHRYNFKTGRSTRRNEGISPSDYEPIGIKR